MSAYIGIKIKAKPKEQEVLLALLSDYSFESFQESDEYLEAFIKSSDWDEEAAEIKQLLRERSTDFEKEDFEDKNWNEEWEKNFQPIRIADELYVRASFHPKLEEVKHEVLITPQMSFGTGHHQTTFLMLSEMLKISFSDMRVLDMGCGTGILAILASKLGAREVLAVDIESWAVENTKQNIAQNGVDQVQVVQADIDLINHHNHFDIILANINRNVLMEHLEHYQSILEKGGDLLLSGFLEDDDEVMRTEISGLGLTIANKSSKDNWIMLHCKK